MPIVTIRESLVGNLEPNVEGAQSSGLVQKRINLPEGKMFRVLSIQGFDDNGGLEGIKSPDNEMGCSREVYATPYPIVPTDLQWGITGPARAATSVTGMGLLAGDNACLYKRLDATSITFTQDEPYSNQQWTQEFPNPNVATNNPFTWFTNHMYLTMKVNWNGLSMPMDVAFSFYIQVEVKDVSSLVSAIGTYKEMLEAQCRTLTSTLNTISPIGGAAGRSMPTWQFGGARPEIMVTSANVLRYYNRVASRAYQDMDSVSAFRTRFKEAVTMVDYDAAFGDTTTNIPDWITLMDVAGVTSGIIRPYPPPVKYTGNGNTVMYDADGLPATIVT
tara:strand:+ start:1819 stop:2814 length:996 start_codon:yes stop_codon:yes gene_type:complete